MPRDAIHSIIADFRTFDSSRYSFVASSPFHDALLQVDQSIAYVMDKMLLEDVMIREHGALRLELPFDGADAVRTTLRMFLVLHQVLYPLFYIFINT
jgi:hypothetical protein